MANHGVRDIRPETTAELERQARVNGPRPVCQECGERLPKAVQRPFCVVHSPYVQGLVHELLGRERRRDAERAPRQVA
jgi:hypothetical protein